LKRVSHDQDENGPETVPSEATTVSVEQRYPPCSVAADSCPPAVVVSTSATSSSSVKDPAPVNSCTAVVSRCSFSIMSLLSLSEDRPRSVDAETSGLEAADADARQLSVASVGSTAAAAESITSRDQSTAAAAAAAGGGSKDSEVRPVPLHFKKRMLNTATTTTVSQSPEPTVIGKPLTTPRRSVTIYQDDPSTIASASTPPAKVGIVISKGRAMTLQDKLQMTTTTTTNSARRSPASVGRSSTAASSPLQVVNRQSTTPLAAHWKNKRCRKPLAKRSLIPPSKVGFALVFSFSTCNVSD